MFALILMAGRRNDWGSHCHQNVPFDRSPGCDNFASVFGVLRDVDENWRAESG
jgi:hypothetical protein